MKKTADTAPVFNMALPKSLNINPQTLAIRLDIFTDTIMMHTFGEEANSYKMVSAADVASALTKELSFTTGLLPPNTLWWTNTAEGPVTAVWVPPGIRRVALQNSDMKARRFSIPLPGLIFLCSPGKPPYVYAAKKRPTGPMEKVYKAPLANVYNDGRTCPGNHKYPHNVAEIPNNFFISFFSEGANLQGRSKKYPKNIAKLWEELDGQAVYPLDDLEEHGQVEDLMRLKV